MRKRVADHLRSHKALILTVVASLVAAVAVGVVFFIGHVQGWFGSTVPTAADWLTASGTAVLAFAAPVSILLLARQIREAQKSAEDERHFLITPVITIDAKYGSHPATPSQLPSNIPNRGWALAAGAVQLASSIRVKLVGAGVALQVRVTFQPLAPGNIVSYLKSTNYPPTVEPDFLLNIVPDTEELIRLTWARPMPYVPGSQLGTFLLSFYFRNSLSRWYLQQFLVLIYDNGQITVEGGSSPVAIDTPKFADMHPLLAAIDELNAEQTKGA